MLTLSLFISSSCLCYCSPNQSSAASTGEITVLDYEYYKGLAVSHLNTYLRQTWKTWFCFRDPIVDQKKFPQLFVAKLGQNQVQI